MTNDMTEPQIVISEPTGADGAPWLVLGHSLGTSSDIWRDAIPLLEEHYRMVTWDLPGHGKAPVAEGPFTIADLSESVSAHLGRRGISRFHYAGVSIGGTVGLDLVLRHASKLDAVVAISTGANVDDPAAWAARAEAVRSEGTGALVEGSRMRWFASTTHERHPARVAETLAALARTDDRSYAWACEALADFDASHELGQVDRPVLALWGDQDALVPESKSSELANALPRGTVRCVPGAAHVSPLEQPAVVASLLTTFLERP